MTRGTLQTSAQPTLPLRESSRKPIHKKPKQAWKRQPLLILFPLISEQKSKDYTVLLISFDFSIDIFNVKTREKWKFCKFNFSDYFFNIQREL